MAKGQVPRAHLGLQVRLSLHPQAGHADLIPFIAALVGCSRSRCCHGKWDPGVNWKDRVE